MNARKIVEGDVVPTAVLQRSARIMVDAVKKEYPQWWGETVGPMLRNAPFSFSSCVADGVMGVYGLTNPALHKEIENILLLDAENERR